MSKNEWKKWMGVVGRLLVAYALILSQSALAGQNQKTKDNANSPQQTTAPKAGEKQQSTIAATAKAQSKQAQAEESESSVAEEKSSGDGKHEGIKVHGHWTIEVRNPDGTLVSHREFENSLLPSAALASILARQNSVGLWEVGLNVGGTPPQTNNCLAIPCLNIAEPGYFFGSSSNNLSVTASGNSLVLSGTITADQSGTISEVQTVGIGCPATVAPSAPCPAGTSTFNNGTPTGAFTFTQANLSQGIPVSAGQIIAFTVNISFS